MKIFKRIIYTLLSLLLLAAVGMVGVILYAEYSGRRFHPEAQAAMADGDFSDGESRLVYDENGNLAELPGSIPVPTESDEAETATAVPASQTESTETEASSDTQSPTADDTSAADTQTETAPASTLTDTSDSTERAYVMDKNSNLFHTADCPYAANISAEYKAEMTTTREKIMNAGYQPCSNCNP